MNRMHQRDNMVMNPLITRVQILGTIMICCILSISLNINTCVATSTSQNFQFSTIVDRNCSNFTVQSLKRILRDLKFYNDTPSRYAQYKLSSSSILSSSILSSSSSSSSSLSSLSSSILSSLSSSSSSNYERNQKYSKMNEYDIENPIEFVNQYMKNRDTIEKYDEIFYITNKPLLLQLVTPEARAFTAGYILHDVLIKNLTIDGPLCTETLSFKMKQILGLVIALNTVEHVIDAHLDDPNWMNELIANHTNTSSDLQICYRSFASDLHRFIYYLSTIAFYKTYCCYKNDGSLDDPFDSSIQCYPLPSNSYGLLHILEAMTVFFFIYISFNILQERLQKTMHKIQIDSLIFKYVTSDKNELGVAMPLMFYFRPLAESFLKFFFTRKNNDQSIKRLNSLTIRVPYFLSEIPIILLILGISFLRFFVPLTPASVVFDEDNLDTYHLSIGSSGNLWKEIESNYDLNFSYLILWVIVVAVFAASIMIQLTVFELSSWFAYFELNEEEMVESEKYGAPDSYFFQLRVVSILWSLTLCIILVVTIWTFMIWSFIVKIIFCLIGCIEILKISKLGLSLPKWRKECGESIIQWLLLWTKLLFSMINEALCIVSFSIASYFAARTFFSFVWYNVLNVILYPSRVPVVLFLATLAIILINLNQDLMLPFNVFYQVLMDKCTDCIIDLSETNPTLKLSDSITDKSKNPKIALLSDVKDILERQDYDYSKVTLSYDDLERLLIADEKNINPIVKDNDGTEYYVMTLELCNDIYETVLHNYTIVDLVGKYLFCIVVSSITFVAFYYLSVFNSFASDQISNVAILLTGFLPNILGAGTRKEIENYFSRRINGAIALQLEMRKCDSRIIYLAVLYNLKSRNDIQAWIDLHRDSPPFQTLATHSNNNMKNHDNDNNNNSSDSIDSIGGGGNISSSTSGATNRSNRNNNHGSASSGTSAIIDHSENIHNNINNNKLNVSIQNESIPLLLHQRKSSQRHTDTDV